MPSFFRRDAWPEGDLPSDDYLEMFIDLPRIEPLASLDDFCFNILGLEIVRLFLIFYELKRVSFWLSLDLELDEVKLRLQLAWLKCFVKGLWSLSWPIPLDSLFLMIKFFFSSKLFFMTWKGDVLWRLTDLLTSPLFSFKLDNILFSDDSLKCILSSLFSYGTLFRLLSEGL